MQVHDPPKQLAFASSTDVAKSTDAGVATRALDELRRDYGSLLARIARAQKDPAAWDGVKAHPDWARLLVRLKFHVLGARMKASPLHEAILGAVCKDSGILRAELDELGFLHTASLHRGDWLPLTDRRRRIVIDAHAAASAAHASTGFGKPVDTALAQARKLMPEARDIDLDWLHAPYAAVAKVLPVINGVGVPTAAALEQAARFVDALGAPLRNEVQRQFRQMGKALRALGASFDEIACLHPDDRKMVVLSATVLAGAADDTHAWLELLADPARRKDHGALRKLLGGVRTGLEYASWFIDQMARGVRDLTDEQGARLLSVRLRMGGGVQLGPVGGRAGVRLHIPSIAEADEAGRVVGSVESYYVPLATPIATAEVTARGTRTTYWAGGVTAAKSDQGSNVTVAWAGLPSLGVGRDPVEGAGFEVGYSPGIGVAGVFDFMVTPSIGFFHPRLINVDRPVGRLSDLIAEIFESAFDIGRAVVSSTCHVGPDLEVLFENAPSPELIESRLGVSRRFVDRARVALTLADVYRKDLAKTAAAGQPIADPNGYAYREARKAFDDAETRAIIDGFLVRTSKKMRADFDAMLALAQKPKSSPWQERKLRAQIRDLGRELRDDERRFAFADLLLSQLFNQATPAQRPTP